MTASLNLLSIGLLFCTVQALEYTCSKNVGQTEMTVNIRQTKGTGAAQLEAIDKVTGQTDGCKSTEVTVGTTTILELAITVTISTRVQSSPTLATANCYVKQDATVGTKVNYAIVQQATAGISVSTDSLFEFSCDSAAIGAPMFNVPAQSLTVVLAPGTVTARTDNVAVKLVDTLGADVSGPLNIGTQVKLRVTYTYPSGATTKEYPVGVRTYNVIAAGSSSFSTPNAVLITANGCRGTSATALAFKLTDSMKYNAAASASGSTVYDSGAFELVMFDGVSPKNLYIRVHYEAVCLDLAEKRCADQQQYCTDNMLSRRRRSADDIPVLNGTLEFMIPLKVGSDATSSESNGSSERGCPTCVVPDMYWIVSLVLGLLLLVVLAICVALVIHIQRDRNLNRKTVQHGRHNPSYS